MADFERIAARVRQANTSHRPMVLLLDYDGTLVDLHDRPGKARASRRLLAILRALSAAPRCRIYMVSGRTASQLSRLLPVKGLGFFGAYGAQVKRRGGHLKWHPGIRPLRGLVAGVFRNLSSNLRGFPDLVLEDKWGCIGIQMRRLSPGRRRSVARKVRRCLLAADTKGLLQVTDNAYGMEVGARGLDKGWAVSQILWNRDGLGGDPLIVYVGDDISDEAAFKVLRNRGVTVCVGNRRKTTAQYRLAGPAEVLELLERILAALNSGNPKSHPRP